VSTPPYSACVWPMDPVCATEAWEALSTEQQQLGLALASATLERLTGYRVSNCPITIRPVSHNGALACGIRPWDGSGWYGYQPFMPINLGGVWSNAYCCDSFSVTENRKTVKLPPPVGRVDEVKVDGAVLDPADYRVDNGNLLIWQGAGDAPWPTSQDLSLPDTEPGTFAVTYLNAYPVDGAGAYAVGVLALEFGKACAGRTCKLPENVTTIVRQGITLEVVSGSFPNGETGLRTCLATPPLRPTRLSTA
jgi:hypothetical protein